MSNVLTAILNLVNGNLDLANLSTSGKNALLQLASAADRRISFGSAALGSFSAGTHLENSIAHGLGRTPVFVMGIANKVTTAAGDSAVAVSLTTFDGTNVGFRATVANGSPSSGAVTIYYLAIG